MNDLIKANGLEVLINMATNGKAKNTRIAYARGIEHYQIWAQANNAGFNRLAVQAYIQQIRGRPQLSNR